MSNFTLPTQFTVKHAAQLANFQSGSASFGPLTVNWTIDLSIPQITVNATVYGISIGNAVINPANPTATLGGNVGVGEATLTLTANFAAQEIDYSVLVSAFGFPIFDKSGTLFSW